MSGFKVKIFTSEGSQTISVVKSHLLIGSADHCDIQLAGGEIAVEHLRVWSDGEHLWGQDLGSQYGTTLNGQSLPPMRPVLFHEADLFKLGISDATLSFHPAAFGTMRAPVVNLQNEGRGEIPAEVVEQIQLLKQANRRLQEEMQQLREESERQARSRGTSVVDPEEEEEISAVKNNALQEIQAMKEAEARRFEVWKRESVDELEAVITDTIRSHAHRKVSNDRICDDVAIALRFTLLGEKPSAVRRRSHSGDGWQRTLLAGVLLCLFVAAGLIYVNRTAHRVPASVVFIPSPSKPVMQKPSIRPGATKNFNK